VDIASTPPLDKVKGPKNNSEKEENQSGRSRMETEKE